LLICGLLLIALPSFVLGREFSIVWEQMGGNRGGLDPAVDEGQVGLTTTSHDTAELSRRVTSLQSALDNQGFMLRRLMNLVEHQARARGGGGASRSDVGGDSMEDVHVLTVPEHTAPKTNGIRPEGAKGKGKADGL